MELVEKVMELNQSNLNQWNSIKMEAMKIDEANFRLAVQIINLSNLNCRSKVITNQRRKNFQRFDFDRP